MLNLYRMEQRIESQMQETSVPGLAMAIVQDQQVVYARGFGVTGVEDGGLPVTPQTLFRIGSTTKPLTGTAIMRLVESGKLDLDEPIKTYINWFTMPDKQAADHLTLRMLLSHTAGMPPGREHFGPRNPEGLAAFVREQIFNLRLVSPPGMILNYSNPGIALAGYVAEVVSGKHFADLMQELVFEPLQMKRTTFDPAVAMTYPLAQAHNLGKDKVLSVQHRFADHTAYYPAGFAMSTVLDLANFAIMQLNQGSFQGQQLLSPQSVRLMHTVQADLYTINSTGYGLTFFTGQYKGARLVWHDGGITSFVCKFVLVPEAQLAIIMLFNRVGLDYEKITHKLLDQLLELPEQEPEPEPIEPSRALWKSFTGNYVGRWVGLARIQIIDEQLTLDLNGEQIPLQAIHERLYAGRKANAFVSVGFLPVPEGMTQFIYIDQYVMARLETTLPFQPDPSMLARYAGTYTLAWENTFIARVRDDQLYLYSKEDDEEMLCTPISATRVTTSMGVFDFHVDEDGQAIALEYGELVVFPRTL